MRYYVLGFYFDPTFENVALIRKNRPDWQAGLLNGIGGKIEPNETVEQAMVREFLEEAGVQTGQHDWSLDVELSGEDYEIYVFHASGPLDDLVSMTDEHIEIVGTKNLPDDVVPNLKWLVAFSKVATATAYDLPLTVNCR